MGKLELKDHGSGRGKVDAQQVRREAVGKLKVQVVTCATRKGRGTNVVGNLGNFANNSKALVNALTPTARMYTASSNLE